MTKLLKSRDEKTGAGAPPEFDLDLFLPFLLNQAAEVTSQSFQQVYRAGHQMSRTQWRIMANLGKHGSLSAVEICKRTFMEKTKVSRAVLALEQKGYLSRSASPGDRRTEQLSLTGTGTKVFRGLGQKALDFDRGLRARLGPDLAGTLEATLRKLVEDQT